MTTTTEPDREPDSVIRNGITELRTACGHSFITCCTDRCFRLPLALRAQRDRLRSAATIEHEKNLAREAARFAAELDRIDATYRGLAQGGQPS